MKRLIRIPTRRTLRKILLISALTFFAAGVIVLKLTNGIDGAYQEINTKALDEAGNFSNKSGRKFLILIWTHGQRLERRFVNSYGKTKRDPYRLCSVRNCALSTDNSKIGKADAVLFHLHQTKGPNTLPKIRFPEQIWIFFTDESPYHTFLASQRYGMADYNKFFNWSMTYRGNSDIPVPYGRIIELPFTETNLPNYAISKNKSVAILGSNCGGKNYRWEYVRELQKHIAVDVYGKCGKLKCPGHFTKDCLPLNDYKFYLAFENSNCKEYLTEKVWWNAFEKGALPVVMGAKKEDYVQLCPPKSFVHVEDFRNPADLASYIKYLDNNDTAYNEYFEWKRKYRVINEHGYFGSPSFHLCHICEKLNSSNGTKKTYDDLESFWNKRTDCSKPSWKPNK